MKDLVPITRCPRCNSSFIDSLGSYKGWIASCRICNLSNFPAFVSSGSPLGAKDDFYVFSGAVVRVDYYHPRTVDNNKAKELELCPHPQKITGNCPDCGAPIYGMDELHLTSGNYYAAVTYSCGYRHIPKNKSYQ